MTSPRLYNLPRPLPPRLWVRGNVLQAPAPRQPQISADAPSGWFQSHRIGSAFGDLRNLPKLLWGIMALWIPKAFASPSRRESLSQIAKDLPGKSSGRPNVIRALKFSDADYI